MSHPLETMINHDPGHTPSSSSDVATSSSTLDIDIVSLMHVGRGLVVLPQENNVTMYHHLALASTGGQMPLLYLLGVGAQHAAKIQRRHDDGTEGHPLSVDHFPAFPILGDDQDNYVSTISPRNGRSTALEILDAALSIVQEGGVGLPSFREGTAGAVNGAEEDEG